MMPANTFKIPSFDGIRALSFLIVFISHDRLEHLPGLFGVVVTPEVIENSLTQELGNGLISSECRKTFHRSGAPKLMMGYSEWKQQRGTERGSA